EKLKGLKECIKGWNRVTYGRVDSKIDKLVEDIKDLDIRSELMGISEDEVGLRKNLFSEMWHLRISKETVLAQRSRLKWLQEGDNNTRYFHANIKSRGKKNFIRAIRVGEDWLEGPSAIRQAVVAHFKEQFSSAQWLRPNLDGIWFPCLLLLLNGGAMVECLIFNNSHC
ncbi:LINE-1 reverse transcriptase like, partial [Trifolium medium]|nr:LINE-1 reverse transcriptase like [Trifolium medium]